MTPNMRLIDVNGLPHNLTEYQVRMMITIGWLTFLAAWVTSICFYITHPSAVDLNPKRFKDKMFIYIFGKKYSLICDCCLTWINCFKTCSNCCSSNSDCCLTRINCFKKCSDGRCNSNSACCLTCSNGCWRASCSTKYSKCCKGERKRVNCVSS